MLPGRRQRRDVPVEKLVAAQAAHGGCMMTLKNSLASVCALGALAVAACGGGGTTPEPTSETSGGEPALVVSDPGEWESLSAEGKITFDMTCGSCHPGGDADLGPALKGHMEPLSHMTKQIREGSGRMAPIDTNKLPEEKMRGLMVYLSTLGAVGDVKGP
jgi:mono/diheme cytochrome c family protein